MAQQNTAAPLASHHYGIRALVTFDECCDPGSVTPRRRAAAVGDPCPVFQFRVKVFSLESRQQLGVRILSGRPGESDDRLDIAPLGDATEGLRRLI